MNNRLLKNILSLPTAPFRESHVASFVTGELERNGVPYFRDPVGNLVLGVSSVSDLKKLVKEQSKEPMCVFMAHMDHPGFHGIKWLSERNLKVKWYGGSPRKWLEGAGVWVADSLGWRAVGKLSQIKLLKSGRALDQAVVRLSGFSKKDCADPSELFGAFRFRAPVWQKGDLIYTEAADDLIGVYSILALAIEHAKRKGRRKKHEPVFLAVLTRAEEVGFVGAIGHFQLGWLNSHRRPVLYVSLETSRTVPGAEFGKGPVIRLGDKATTFDPASLRVFSHLGAKVLKDKHQKRIMDGGTCEGTVAMAYGFPTVAIAVPLGNYHNESFEGGPDSRGNLGPGPEFVHMNDVKGMVTLCRGLLKSGLAWDDPWGDMLKQLGERYRGFAGLLK